MLAALLAICLVALYLLPHLDSVTEILLSYISDFSGFVAQAPLTSFVLVFLFYILLCAVPFPFVSVVTLAVGYLFGFAYGIILVSFGSAIGGLIMFLLARRFLNAAMGARLLARFPSIKPILQADDIWVATSIRFIPGLPFFLPSLVMSMTQISAFKFYLSTQLGLLLTVVIYVNAGSSLANLNAVGGSLYSPRLVVSMLLIAILPIGLKILNKYRES